MASCFLSPVTSYPSLSVWKFCLYHILTKTCWFSVFLILAILLDLCHDVVFICIFLMSNEEEHSYFVCVWVCECVAIWISSFVKFLFQFFCSSFNWVYLFFLIYLSIWVLCQLYDCKSFLFFGLPLFSFGQLFSLSFIARAFGVLFVF